MNYDTIPSLPRLFFDQAQKLGAKPFLWRKEDDAAFRPIRWNRVAADVRALARGLIALGVKPGDRVALIAENRPEWLISDLAIMAVGAITVPAFSTNTVDDNRHVLTHSGARGVIISNPGIAKRVLPASMLAPELNFLIAMESLTQTQQLPLRFLSWSEAMSLGDPKLDADIEERVGSLARDETCCIIYTSGTGGVPKGVMLTHGSILATSRAPTSCCRKSAWATRCSCRSCRCRTPTSTPAGQFLPIAIGAQIYYAEGVDKLADNMAEAQADHHDRGAAALRGDAPAHPCAACLKATPFQRKTVRPRRTRWAARTTSIPARSPSGSGCQNCVLRAYWCGARCGARFGGRLKALVSGGAALNYEVGVFFLALGVPLLQGYGQTEASPGDQRQPAEAASSSTPSARPSTGVEVQHRRGRRDPGARRSGDEGLLARPGRDRARDRRRLAAYRRHRRVRRRRLPQDHRPQEGHHRAAPAATMSRRRGSRASWCCSPRSRRRWSMATASRTWWR